MGPLFRLEAVLPLLLGLLWASVQDVRTRRISNVLNGGLAAAGMIAWILAAGSSGFWHAGAGCLGGLALGGLIFWIGGFGAGDAKLLAAVGAWSGIAMMPAVVLWTAAWGGVVSLAVLLFAKHQKLDLDLPRKDRPQSARVPYGVAIAAGTITAVLLARGHGGA